MTAGEGQPPTASQLMIDHFAEIEACLVSIQGALRHRQHPQDVHFHRALKACRDGTNALERRSPVRADRDAVLEEAAKVADDFVKFKDAHPESESVHRLTASDIADCIRALKAEGVK